MNNKNAFFCNSLLLGQFQLKLFYCGKGRQNFVSNVTLYPCERSRQNHLENSVDHGWSLCTVIKAVVRCREKSLGFSIFRKINEQIIDLS